MRAAAALTVLLVACGDPPVMEVDAGRDAGGPGEVDAGVTLSPVSPAVLPRFPCPDGWSERALEGGPTVCDPFPDGRLACPDDAWQPPGSATCVRLGPDCPSGDFADDEPPTGIVYVRAGASGGDGSRGAPFGAINDAVAAASDGDTILLAAGLYEGELVRIERPLTLRGVCLDAVLGTASSISVRSPGVRVEDLRFQGASRGGVVWSGDLTMRSVAMRDVGSIAVAAFGGAVDLADVSIRLAAGEGISVSGGALTARRVEVVDVQNALLLCVDATCDVEDIVLYQPASAQMPAGTLSVGGSASARVERAWLSNERSVNISSGGELSLTDVVVRGPGASGTPDEIAVFAFDGAITIDRAWIDQTQLTAITAGGAQGSLVARDVVVTGVEPVDAQGAGYGLFVTDGATASVERAWIEDASGAGVLVTGTGTSAEVRDLHVRRIRAAPASGLLGRGIQVQLGAQLIGERVDIRDTPESGIIVNQTASATLTELVIADIHERVCASSGCPPAGNGLATYLGGQADLERFRISGVALAGIQLAMGGVIDATDGEVFDNPVGVNVQDESYPLARLTTGVVYRDNGVNLDATSFEIPDPTPPAIPGL